MVQTVISQYGAAAFKGLLDGIEDHDVMSYAAEEAIPMAYPLQLGTNPDKQVKKALTGAAVIGFALHDQARVQDSLGVVQYGINETVSVLRKGRFWVQTSDAVLAGAIANVTVADGTLTDAAVAAGIEAITQLQVTFLTSTSAAGLALVEVK